MNATSKFWPLDYDQEVEIYENLSWDLPGWKRFGRRNRKPRGRLPRARRSNSDPRP
jgi:hypothetical protein